MTLLTETAVIVALWLIAVRGLGLNTKAGAIVSAVAIVAILVLAKPWNWSW